MINMINIYMPNEIKKWDREFLEAKFFSLQFITNQLINYINNNDETFNSILKKMEENNA